MDFIFIALGLSTMWLFMFKIEWLFNYKFFLLNIFYDIALFGGALILMNYKIGNPKMVVTLLIPLISSIVFFVLYILFKKIYKRNPENTFWTFTKMPIQDVVFTVLFWFLGVGLPVFIIV